MALKLNKEGNSIYLLKDLGWAIKLLPFLIASLITLHFSYGFGYLKGIWDFIVFKKHLKKKIKDMPLTR